MARRKPSRADILRFYEELEAQHAMTKSAAATQHAASRAGMAYFDEMPPAVRQLLDKGKLSFPCHQVASALRRFPVQAVIQSMKRQGA